MEKIFPTLVYSFLVALGIMVGGSLTGSLGALICREPPLKTMVDLADKLKIWALAAALGGTFAPIRVIEAGFLEGQLLNVARQILFIISAFYGAHLGYRLILLLAGGR